MRFFLDNNLAPRHARALAALLAPEHEVVHLRDKFPASIDDATWLAELGREGGWIVICGDVRIAKATHLRAAWRHAKLTTFFLKPAWMNMKLLEQHARLARCFDQVIDTASRAPSGARFSLGVQGRIQRLES